MSAKTHRLIGFIIMLLAIVIAVLNLQRTVNLGLKNLPVLLVILGAVLIARARKLEKQQP
jgi:uncharacterized membrane protein